jgi:hypothetical protein
MFELAAARVTEVPFEEAPEEPTTAVVTRLYVDEKVRTALATKVAGLLRVSVRPSVLIAVIVVGPTIPLACCTPGPVTV